MSERLRIQYTLTSADPLTTELIDWPKNKFKSEANFLQVATDYLHGRFGMYDRIHSTKMYNETVNQKSNNMKSRFLLSTMLVAVLLVSCQDPSSASPTYVSPDGGAFGGGWWLIPLIGAGLGFLFMFFSFEAIKKGEFWREDDPRGPGYPPIQKRRPSTKKWYQVPTGYVAIGLWVLTIIAVIIRATTFH